MQQREQSMKHSVTSLGPGEEKRKRAPEPKPKPKPGLEIHQLLLNLGIETPYIHAGAFNHKTQERIAKHYREILRALGMDLNNDSLAATPARVAKMYCEEVFYGLDYSNFPKVTAITNGMQYDEMIATKCQVRSLCEHHAIPFMGTAFIGYLPGTKILGLSKFNRVVDFFSRRPQVQERLTEQISAALRYILSTDDVAVVIEAEHLCVQLRGVQDESSTTVTSKLCGRFRTVPEARSEFLALTRQA
jgi:GTP cyclohydrolase I